MRLAVRDLSILIATRVLADHQVYVATTLPEMDGEVMHQHL